VTDNASKAIELTVILAAICVFVYLVAGCDRASSENFMIRECIDKGNSPEKCAELRL
jgi:uncharacterized protein YgiB involved in biofilm formation